MTAPNNMTPDSTILQQIQGEWQKLAMMILWKLAGPGKPVAISAEDMKAMNDHFPGGAVLFTHGKVDAIEFSLVAIADAQRIAEHAAATGSATVQ